MSTMTMTAKPKRTSRLFETPAKTFGGRASVENTEKHRDSEAVRKLNELCRECQKFARETGLTPDDITAAIKEVRRRNRLERANSN